jgi:hypothetical protein
MRSISATVPRLLAALAALVSASACELSVPPRAPTVSLRVRGGPPNATVTIDDEYVGPLEVVQVRGVALPIGKHRVSVEAPGYLPVDKIVEAKDELVRLDVQLVPIPD